MDKLGKMLRDGRLPHAQLPAWAAKVPLASWRSQTVAEKLRSYQTFMLMFLNPMPRLRRGITRLKAASLMRTDCVVTSFLYSSEATPSSVGRTCNWPWVIHVRTRGPMRPVLR